MTVWYDVADAPAARHADETDRMSWAEGSGGKPNVLEKKAETHT